LCRHLAAAHAPGGCSPQLALQAAVSCMSSVQRPGPVQAHSGVSLALCVIVRLGADAGCLAAAATAFRLSLCCSPVPSPDARCAHQHHWAQRRPRAQ
jgi:hypothetical protein